MKDDEIWREAFLRSLHGAAVHTKEIDLQGIVNRAKTIADAAVKVFDERAQEKRGPHVNAEQEMVEPASS